MIAQETPVCYQVIEEKDLRGQASDIGSRAVTEKISAKVI